MILPIIRFMVISRAKNVQIWGHFELFLAYSLPILALETVATLEQDAMHTEISFYIINEHRQSLGSFLHNIEAQD